MKVLSRNYMSDWLFATTTTVRRYDNCLLAALSEHTLACTPTIRAK